MDSKKTQRDKLIYISASEYPSTTANSVQVIKQCNGFDEIGLKVLIFARESNNTSSSIEDIHLDYAISEGIELRLMKSWRYVPRKILSLFYPLWVALQIPSDTKVIYGRHYLGLLTASIFKGIESRVIYECHAPSGSISSYFLKKFIAFDLIDRVVVISSALKKIIAKSSFSIEEKNIIVAHDACDTTDTCLTESENVSVGYVGSFYRGRGLELISKVASSLPEIKFHLVGDTKEKYRECFDCQIPENMIFHGRVAPADLSSHYSRFNVALAPYQNKVYVKDGSNTVDYMSPLKIFEYMGYGKAIISSDLPVLREVLKSEHNSLMVDADCSDSWVKAIERMKDLKFRKKYLNRQELNHSQSTHGKQEQKK